MFRVEPSARVTDVPQPMIQTLQHATRRALMPALACALVLSLGVVAGALGADPTPGPSPMMIDPLDPRAGDGASTVGAPFLALLAVVALGAIAAAGTIAYVRLTARR